MQRVLDSSPVNLRPAPVITKRSLKRTASLASLPTPPRTSHKNKRSRKDISDDEDKFETSESEPDAKPLARELFKPKGIARKPKISEKAAEDAFWMGKEEEKVLPRQEKRKERTKVPSTIGSAPVSPPPSRSKQVGPRFKTPPPLHERALSPVSSTGDPLPDPDDDDNDGPIRDSPNNVFLVSSKKAHPMIPIQDTAEEFEEPPMVRYVFRGKPVEWPNPYYNVSPGVHERARLPREHPEYSPAPTVQPKRLFTKELASKDKKKTKRRRSASPASPSVAATRPKRKASPVKSSPSRSPGKTKKKRVPTSKTS